jgi:hexokinase
MNASFNPRSLTDFARYYGFHYSACDPYDLVKDLAVEMERGLRGDASTLPMLPSYIKPVNEPARGKTVIALDAGGTNLRAARIHFGQDGKPVEEASRKAAMPGTKGQISAASFFSEIADAVAPLLDGPEPVEGLGFCFSYPMETLDNADARVLMFSKEVDAPEVVGKEVGAGLAAELAKRGAKVPERIVLLNDTTAALLAGTAEIPADGGLNLGPRAQGGPVIGFILGTGMNVAYPESSIPKIGFEDRASPQVVVCETGNFRTRYLGRLDAAFDAGLKNPGSYTYEKTMSGAYLGGLALCMLKQAAADDVLALADPAALANLAALPTKDVTSFMRAPYSGEGALSSLLSRESREAVSSATFLCSILIERAALFAAASIAAAVERTGAGYDPLSPVRVAVEGTTFMVVRGLRPAFESYLHQMLSASDRRSAMPRRAIVSPVAQASLFGAAVAALSR